MKREVMKIAILAFILILCFANSVNSTTVFFEQVSNDISIGIYGQNYENVVNTCLNPNCNDSGQVINIFLGSNYTCSSLAKSSSSSSSSSYFLDGNSTTINFDIPKLLGAVLNNNTCSFSSLISNTTELLSALPRLKKKIQINIIQGNDAPKSCNGTCSDDLLQVNIYLTDICIDDCFCSAQYENTTEYVISSSSSLTNFSVEICVNSNKLINQGVVSPYINWTLEAIVEERFGKPFNSSKEKRNANLTQSSTIAANGVATGQFSYQTSSPITLVSYSLVNSYSGASVPLSFTTFLAAQTSSGIIENGICTGKACCLMVSDCIVSLRYIQTLNISSSITAGWPVGADALCPYPTCNWAYKYDSSLNICVYSNTVAGQPVLTHDPYTSLRDCAEDFSRSNRPYCLESLTKAFRVCKHNAGLP